VLRGLAFLLLNVIGPLAFGAARETIQSLAPKRWGGKGVDVDTPPQTQMGYALGFGALWVVGYLALRVGITFIGWVAGPLFGRLAPGVPGWLHSALLPVLIFVIGAVVGALAYNVEE
jgi:hypothetical protein